MFNVEPDAQMTRSYEEAERALRARREKILIAIENKETYPTMGVLEELAKINIKLGEA